MITILCSGSRGDIQPYLALAVQLKRLGKAVRIAAGKSFQTFIESYGIECYPLSLDYLSADVDPELIKLAQNSDNVFKMMLAFNKMKQYAVMMTDEMYLACQDSELVVYHPGCTIGYFTAQAMGIPAVLASPFPFHRTNERRSVIAYDKPWFPKQLSYSILQGMLWTASKLGVKAFWQEKYGRLPQPFTPQFERVSALYPAIVSCSNYIFSRPQDWSQHIYQAGYWLLNEPDDYQPSEQLRRFLVAGEPPIYFGFGSVFNIEEKEHFIKVITEALALTKQRGIICGMGDNVQSSQQVYFQQSIPHGWLFPQLKAVCHHGGAGTSAAGFCAGRPSIIMPFSNDQFAWAQRSYELGVGAKPLSKKHLSTPALVAAINYVTQPEIIDNAHQLGQQLATENGAYDCAQVLVKLIDRDH